MLFALEVEFRKAWPQACIDNRNKPESFAHGSRIQKHWPMPRVNNAVPPEPPVCLRREQLVTYTRNCSDACQFPYAVALGDLQAAPTLRQRLCSAWRSACTREHLSHRGNQKGSAAALSNLHACKPVLLVTLAFVPVPPL